MCLLTFFMVKYLKGDDIMKNEKFRIAIYGIAFSLLGSYISILSISNTNYIFVVILLILVFVVIPIIFLVHYLLLMFDDKTKFIKITTFLLSYMATLIIVVISMMILISGEFI